MTDDEIQRRLKDREDHFVERKTEGDHKDFLKTIVAFANSVPDNQTAILFIGVRDDGKVAGLQNPDSLQNTLSEICERKCYPKSDPQPVMRVLREGETEYLAVVVEPSKNRPHFGGPAWTRAGSKTIVASDRLFQELVDSRTSKVHEILKCKGKVVRVIWVFKNTPPVMSISEAMNYPAPCECIVEGCNSHYVELMNCGSQNYFSEPLGNVLLRKGTGGRCLDILIQRN
jgi:hypothetical protein